VAALNKMNGDGDADAEIWRRRRGGTVGLGNGRGACCRRVTLSFTLLWRDMGSAWMTVEAEAMQGRGERSFGRGRGGCRRR
jgi:hypothetical protein